MSRRLQSSAIKRRISNVGATLGKNSGSTNKVNILKWVKDNPRSWDKLWQFMESGLVWGLLEGDDGAGNMPDNCTKLAHIQDPTKKQLYRRGLQPVAFSKDAQAKYRVVDKQWTSKAFVFKYQREGSLPMKPAMKMVDVRAVFDAMAVAMGNRHIKCMKDDIIDVENMRCYAFVRKDPESGDVLELKPSNFDQATDIQQLFSEDCISFADLGLGKMNSKSTTMHNYSDKEAYIHTGKMALGKLFDAFKDVAFFKNEDARITLSYKGDGWKELVGATVFEKRMLAKNEFADAASALLEAKEKAEDLGAATASFTPSKKRRSVD